MQSSRKLFKLISGAAENGSVAQQLENGLVPTRHRSGWKKTLKFFKTRVLKDTAMGSEVQQQWPVYSITLTKQATKIRLLSGC